MSVYVGISLPDGDANIGAGLLAMELAASAALLLVSLRRARG